MKKLITTAFALTLAAAMAPAYAHADKFQERLQRQSARIEQGVESGELTRREANILRREHRELRQLTHLLAGDGRLSKSERRMLNEKYDDTSDLIWRLKHNDQHRHRHSHRAEPRVDRHALASRERRFDWRD